MFMQKDECSEGMAIKPVPPRPKTEKTNNEAHFLYDQYSLISFNI